jgi:hypothetical protein
MTTALQCRKTLKPYTLAGFEPGIIGSVGGRDGHFAMPPDVSTYRVIFTE